MLKWQISVHKIYISWLKWFCMLYIILFFEYSNTNLQTFYLCDNVGGC